MGSTERRARHKEELRRKILDAARAIIMEEGFAALTMRRIAERIDYSPAAIYLHFTDREEIARDLSREGFGELLQCLQPTSAAVDPWVRLREISRAYVSFGMAHPETYKLIFMEDARYMKAIFARKEPVTENDPATESFRILFRAAQDLKQAGLTNKQIEPLELTETIWTAVHGIVSLKLTCTDFLKSSAERLVEITFEAIEQGLRPARKAAKKNVKIKQK